MAPSCFDLDNIGAKPVPQEIEDDAFLAKELNALSMVERERLYEELHGVNAITEEPPAFLEERITAIKTELAKFSVTKRRAFDRALFLRPGMENDKSLYLMFLRGERFDHERAAIKLCLHFEHKLELFGEAKLPKVITLDDMDEDDMACFQSGSQIILPKKDRAGRAVDLINISQIQYKHWKNQVRYTWYNIFNVLLDDETQKNGIVDVLYFVDMHGIPENMLQYVRDSHHILSAMPLRSCGFHVCYNSEVIRPFLSFLHMVTSKERRLRERVHFGSHLEVQYELCTYGIQLGYVPSGGQQDDTFSKDYIDGFLRKRIQMEAELKRRSDEEETRTGLITHPNPIDVLCGRGRPYQDFEGNLRVGRIVEHHVSLYIETKERLAKTTIAIEIVQMIEEEGGRFLSRKDDGWEIANAKVARGKISQALRVRALKKIRGGHCEPAPIKELPTTPEHVMSRDFKRQRISLEDDDMDLLDFDLEEILV